MRHTAAYINWGRWVADCPQDGCTNALIVQPGQEQYVCGWNGDPPVPGCRGVAMLDWPENPDAVMAELAGRPESQQHWRPEPEEQKAQ